MCKPVQGRVTKEINESNGRLGLRQLSQFASFLFFFSKSHLNREEINYYDSYFLNTVGIYNERTVLWEQLFNFQNEVQGKDEKHCPGLMHQLVEFVIRGLVINESLKKKAVLFCRHVYVQAERQWIKLEPTLWGREGKGERRTNEGDNADRGLSIAKAMNKWKVIAKYTVSSYLTFANCPIVNSISMPIWENYQQQASALRGPQLSFSHPTILHFSCQEIKLNIPVGKLAQSFLAHRPKLFKVKQSVNLRGFPTFPRNNRCFRRWDINCIN